MIKELMHDLIFLAGKSEVVTKDDLQVARDAPHPTVPFLLFYCDIMRRKEGFFICIKL